MKKNYLIAKRVNDFINADVFKRDAIEKSAAWVEICDMSDNENY